MGDKSGLKDEEEQKKEVEDEKVAPKGKESQDQDKKKEGEIESEGKQSSEETKTDKNGESEVPGETSQNQQNGDGEKEKTATESVDAEQKPMSEIKQDEGKESDERPKSDPKHDERKKSSERPLPASSALERRMTAYGRNRAASVSYQRRLSGMSSAHPSDPTGPGYVWDHIMLNCPQFVQLIDLFLGPDPEDTMVDTLSSFIRNNYTETAQASVGWIHSKT